jgi:hypothetical protein
MEDVSIARYKKQARRGLLSFFELTTSNSKEASRPSVTKAEAAISRRTLLYHPVQKHANTYLLKFL